MLRGYQKSGILCTNWELTLAGNYTLRPLGGREIVSEASPICLMHPIRFWNTSWAMDDIPYNISSHLMYSMATGNLVFFLWNLRVDEGMEIGTVRPICSLQKQSEASFICIVQLRMVLKHFISNGCVSMWDNIPFAILWGYQNILCAIWE